MSFRKRNIGLSAGADRLPAANGPAQPPHAATIADSSPGIRPSPDDGRPTTSTGTPSLDNLLAGHGGLPLGKMLLVEENGTTDFAGALLRYYAAEGVVQEQRVHVVGVPEQWGRSLPGLIGSADTVDEKPDKRKGERMKIAWRYERLGEFGAGVAGSRGEFLILICLIVPFRNHVNPASSRSISRSDPGRNERESGEPSEPTGILSFLRPHKTSYPPIHYQHDFYTLHTLSRTLLSLYP